MARFFALGPLVLILRMVLYVSADQSTNPTPPTAHTPALPITAGSASNQKETQRSTSISPRRTTIQQQNTETTESTSDQEETQTSTSISPTHTTIQQKNTDTTVHQSNSPTPIPSTNTSADTSTKVTQSNLSNLTTSSNTPADTSTKETAPSPPRTPKQTSLSTDKDTLPGSSIGSITSPPITTITSLTSTQTTSTLHTSTNITVPSHTPTQTSLSPDQDTQPSSSNDSITSPPTTTITSLPSTHPTSTLHTSTNITGTTEGPCQYSVFESVKVNEAHVVNITGSKDQIYTIRIKEKHNEIRAEQISHQTVFKIPFEWLKPCTVYTVSVDDCKLSGNNIFTSSKNGETVPKTVVTSVTDNEVCLKGEFTGIQWDLTECVEITEQNSCAHTHTVVLDTCNYTMNVTLPPVKPHINFTESIPSQFEWMNKPERCNAALLNINCINNENKKGTVYGLNTPVSLLPDTLHSCTGEYPREKQPIKSNELSFRIECDWKKNGRFRQKSSSSLEISWTSLEGDQCSGIEWDSYSVSCTIPNRHGNNHPGSCTQDSVTSTVCSITGLSPYTDYTCSITGTVKQTNYVIYTGNNTTLSDKPIFRSQIEVTHPSHNSLEIKCKNNGPKIVWNGGEGTFQAEITYNGEPLIIKPKTKCSFHFQDLYYLTTYKIKITAKNREGDSAFITSEATTRYNVKAVFGFRVFLGVVTSVALLFVFFEMYFHKRKRDGEDEEYDNCM